MESDSEHVDIPPQEPRKSFLTRNSTILILAAIMILAAFFRFFGRDFDQGTNQHPDERAIVDRTLQVAWPSDISQLFNAQTSPMNLRSFGRYPWGTLPVYVVRGATWVVDQVAPLFNSKLPEHYYLRDYHGQQLMGRTMASIFDLISLLLVFVIARRLYSSRTALIATALVAFSVTNIQIAHFYITEPFLVTFMLTALYFSVRLMQKPSWWAAAGAGLFIGFSVASKVTSALIFLMVIAAVALRAGYRLRSRKLGAELDDPVGMVAATAKERSLTFRGHFLRGLRYVAVAALFTIIGFGISEPYVYWQFDFSKLQPIQGQTFQETFNNFMSSNPWGQAVIEEAGTQSGSEASNGIPFTRQYVGTVPVLYHFEQLVFWGVGIVPGLSILIGLGIALWLAIKRRPAEIILLACALPYFATILIGETKWMRYMLPLAVVFSILSAAWLSRGAKWAAEKWPRTNGARTSPVRTWQRNAIPAFTVLAILFSFLWAVAYSNIYTQDESRVQASAWMYENIPDGSTMSEGTSWDDALPIGLAQIPGQAPRDQGARQFTQTNLEFYDDHTADEELRLISGWMNQTDYIYFSSNRLYGSIPHLPWRYPVQTTFYQLLYAGKLGYQLVHTEQVLPEIFGIQFYDQLADESFSVYDHPRVDIFKKTTTLTEDQMRTLFATALNFPLEEYSTARHSKIEGDKSLMYQQPLAEQPVVGDYAWNPLAQNDTQWIGVALWLLAVYVIGFAALPICFIVFKRLPDKGYAFAKLAGLLLVSFIVWMTASAHLIPFTVWSVLGSLLVVAAFSALLWRLGTKYEVRDFIRRKRNLILFYEGIFLLAFFFMVFIRMLNPDVWHTAFGGEKTMEFGFLNAALRSPWMPPADPFFSGGYINYYYHGQFIIGCLIKLVGIDPAIAFNLGLAVIYALTFLASASLAYNIVAWSRARRGSTQEVSRVGLVFAFLGGIMVMVFGNFSTLAMWLMVAFPSTAETMLAWGRDLHLTTETWSRSFTEFYFWPASRIIPNTINEFPYWSYLYGDLHPHLIDMPFTLMTAALGVNLVFAGRYIANLAANGAGWFRDVRARSFSAWQWLWGTGGVGALTFVFTALSLGGLFVTNSWDFPTFAGFLGGAVFVALLLARKSPATDPLGKVLDNPAPERGLGFRGGLVLAIASFASVGVLAGLSLLFYLPFFLNFKAFFTKLGIITDGALIPGTNAIMHRTTIWEFIAVWGIFLFIAISYLVVRLWNFPWRGALADLVGIVPGGSPRTRTARSAPSAAAAIAYEPSATIERKPLFTMRRTRPLALAPAFAGAGGAPQISATFSFRTESQSGEDAVDRSERDAALGDGNGHDYGEPIPAANPVDRADAGEVNASDTPISAIRSLVGDWTGVQSASDTEPEAEAGAVVSSNGHAEDEGFTAADADIPTEPIDDLAAAAPNGFFSGDDSNVLEDAGISQPPISSWVADAVLEDQKQQSVVVVRPATPSQPGVIPLWGGFAILMATAALTALQFGTGQPVIGLLVALIGGLMGTLLSTTRSAATLAGGLILVVGLIVTLGVELVYLGDHNAGGDYYRMNTVFKFYTQAWLLIAIGCATAIYLIYYGLRERKDPEPAREIYSYEDDYESSPVAQTVVEEDPLSFTALPSLANTNDPEDLHTNGAASPATVPNGHVYESGEATIPLRSAHPTTNWLVWSTEEITSTNLPTGVLPELEDTPIVAPATVQIEESIAPLATRPLHRAMLADKVREVPATEVSRIEAVAEREADPAELLRIKWSGWRIAWSVAAVAFLLIGFIFPLYGTPNKVAMRIQPNTPMGTLSGLTYMENATFSSNIAPFAIQMKYDLEGINWLNKNVKGLDVIAELPAEYYRDGGMRISSNTGLPMIIGGLHQEEQRGTVYERLIGDRRQDVNELYTTPDIQRALTIISKYDVEYIYVGQLEVGYIRQQEAANHISAESALRKFEQMADPKIGILVRVCCDPQPPAGVVGTIIYKVTHADQKDPKELVGSPVEGSGVPGVSITPLPTSTPVPPPTPPVDDPELMALIAAATSRPTDIDAQQRLFEWYRDHDYPLEAAKVLEQMIALNPTDVARRHMLGDMYQAAGMPDEALKAWEDARDVSPDNPDAHNKVGIAYMDRKRYDDAQTEFQATVELNPAFVEAWFHLGQVYEIKGDKDNAINAYQGAVDNSKEANGWKDESQKRIDALR